MANLSFCDSTFGRPFLSYEPFADITRLLVLRHSWYRSLPVNLSLMIQHVAELVADEPVLYKRTF